MKDERARSAAPAASVAESPRSAAVGKRRTEGSILLATNGSTEGDAALRFAVALARRKSVPLRIITVLEPLPSLPSEFTTSAHHYDIERKRVEEVLKQAKETAAAGLESSMVETGMLMGQPAGVIASAARSWRSAYIVLGAGRRGKLERMFIGDTAVKILRDAIAPVIAVPATCGELPRIGLAAVDFGPASLLAARAAADVMADGVIHLVHVRPDIDIPASDPNAWADGYESGARILLDRLAAELAPEYPSVHFETAIAHGHAAQTLIEYADSVSAELVAVGQHSRSRIERFLFGSVASGIVRSAPCSVLVSPAAQSEGAAQEKEEREA
jgi:nucleotide-binding universal stress UspA family protein